MSSSSTALQASVTLDFVVSMFQGEKWTRELTEQEIEEITTTCFDLWFNYTTAELISVFPDYYYYPNDFMRLFTRLGSITWVQKAADLGATNFDCCFNLAAQLGNTTLFYYFVGRGAKDFDCALKIAAKHGQFEIVRETVGLGARKVNKAGLAAAKFGHLEIVKFLVASGANNYKDIMYQAKLFGRRQIVDFISEIMTK